MMARVNLWIWRLLWALPVLLVATLFAIYAKLPVDGATGDLNSFTPAGYEVQWVIDPRPGGLRVGDVIVRAGGHTYAGWLQGAERGPQWERGGTVTYEVRRGDQIETLHIEMQPLPPGALIRHWGIPLAGGLGLFLIASLVFWSRQEDRAARWFMLCCMMFGVQQFADGWNFQFTILTRPEYFWLQFYNEHISYGLAFTAMVIAAMTFPTTNPCYARHTRLLTGLLAALFPAAIFGTFLVSPSITTALQRSNVASVVMAGIYVIPAGWLLYQAIRHTADAAMRAQIRYLLVTVVTLAALAIPLYYIPIVLMGRPIAPAPIMSAAVLLIPLAFALAILRVKLYNIHFIVNRSMVYGTLTVILVIFFSSSVLVVNALVDVFGGGPQTVIAIAVAAGLSGLLFQPTRRRLQRFIDRRFFHIDIDYEAIQKLQHFAEIRPKQPGEKISWRGMEMELIQRGGMSEIYRAHHPALNRTVAVKLLSPNLLHDPHSRRRFQREASIVSRLHHPNIIPLHEFGESEGLCFIIMDYVEGPSLSAYLKECGRLPLEQTLSIIGDLTAALDHIHAQRLVHRDVKPSNVMLRPAGDPKGPAFQAILADFGIAKVVASTETNLTLAGTIGTFDYMSPEQIQGRTAVDGRTDIYALGVMTYELLTGEKPFPANSAGPVLIAHLQQPAPDPRTLAPDLSEGVAQAIMRAMAKRPADRFSAAGDFLAEMVAGATQLDFPTEARLMHTIP